MQIGNKSPLKNHKAIERSGLKHPLAAADDSQQRHRPFLSLIQTLGLVTRLRGILSTVTNKPLSPLRSHSKRAFA
jgi:hypothetical protein